MTRSHFVTIASAAVWLLFPCTAEAGWPPARAEFARQVHGRRPVPRMIEVSPPLPTHPAMGHSHWGNPAQAQPYPWGYFGAHTGRGFTCRSTYYGDVVHWWD